MSRVLRIYFMYICCAAVMAASSLAYAEPSSLVSKKTIRVSMHKDVAATNVAFTKEIFTVFADSIDHNVVFSIMPFKRLRRELKDNFVDIQAYMDEVKGARQTLSKHPIVRLNLTALTHVGNQIEITKILSSSNSVLSWGRGFSLGKIVEYQGAFIETDDLSQGVRLVHSQRVNAHLDWHTEIDARSAANDIDLSDLKRTVLVRQIPIYPVAQTGTPGEEYVTKFGEWLFSEHKAGRLMAIYERHYVQSSYPFANQNSGNN